MTGSAKPPLPGVEVPERDPIYGYQASDVPEIDEVPVHDRERDHRGLTDAVHVLLSDDITDTILAGADVDSVLILLSAAVSDLEATGST